MSGSVLTPLGPDLDEWQHDYENFVGTGMHGGIVFPRGSAASVDTGKQVGVVASEEEDHQVLHKLVGELNSQGRRY
jgi:glutamate synthase domain-containing protein 3